MNTRTDRMGDRYVPATGWRCGLTLKPRPPRPSLEPLEDRRLLDADLGIVDGITMARGLFHTDPAAVAGLAFNFSIDLTETGRVTGMTLVTPDDVAIPITDHDVSDGEEEWYLEEDAMSPADHALIIDGIYELRIDFGGTVETVVIDFRQDNGDPIPEITQQPLPVSPAHGATSVPTNIDLSWSPVSDANVNLIVVGLDAEPAGMSYIDEFIEDPTVSSLTGITLADDTTYEANLIFAHGIVREHAMGFDILVGTYIGTSYGFTTAGQAPPDLVAEFGDFVVPDELVPGDKFKVTVLVTNDGPGTAEGPFQLNLYTSADEILDIEDELIAQKSMNRLRLKPGQTKKFNLKAEVPGDADPATLRIAALADAYAAIAEMDEDNNLVFTDETRDIVYKFGSFADRRNVKLTVQTGANSTALLKLSGPGYGELIPDGDYARLQLCHTSTASSFKAILKGDDPQATLTQVLVCGDLNKFDAPGVDLVGDFDASGEVPLIKLDDVAPLSIDEQLLIEIGGEPDGKPVKIFADQVMNASLSTDSPIRMIRVNRWLDRNGARDQIVGPWATKIDSRGEFEANVILSDPTVSYSLKKLTASLWLSNCEIRTASSIGTVSTARMDGVTLYAGIAAGVSELPADISAFASDAMISKLVVSGDGGSSPAFEHSRVAASLLRKVQLGDVSGANGGIACGFAAHEVTKYTRPGVALKKLSDPGDHDAVDDYVLRVI
jgi:hypothetical protein